MLELNLNLLAEIGGWAALKEARALVERGRVSNARREGDVIRASVKGAEKVHEPQIMLADRVANVEVRCTCAEFRKTGRVCPHALAAGVALLPGSPRSQGMVTPVVAARRTAEPTASGTFSGSEDSVEPSPEERPRIVIRTRSDGAFVFEDSRGPAKTRIVPQAKLPEFLSRDLPLLERTGDVIFAPGVPEFLLEIASPEFEARLEGTLTGLTLDLVARYADKTFPLSARTEPSSYQQYFPDARQPNRFWRRNVIAERQALAQVEAAGFGLARNGTSTYSLSKENIVARFLANTLPRWKRDWTVTFGPRLEATMADVGHCAARIFPAVRVRPGLAES